MQLFDHPELGGDFESLHFVQGNVEAIVCLHNTKLGPAFGGIRRVRMTQDEAVQDAMRLAGMMTLKCSLAGLDAGGGKTVILDKPGMNYEKAYQRIGQFVEDLGGKYVCGPDVGTGETELEYIREKTNFVNPRGNDAGASTARGVMAGIRALKSHMDLPGDFTVNVQGLGNVGMAIATQLHNEGAKVSACDLNPTRVQAARQMGITILDPDQVTRTAADLFVPCAFGGIITSKRAEKIPVQAICGSANNQLRGGASRILHERGIHYLPDFLVNAGAVIEGFMTLGAKDPNQARSEAAKRIDEIGVTALKILNDGGMPNTVATRMAQERLELEP